MEPFNVAVALRVMIGRSQVRDAEPRECFQEARRSELRPLPSCTICHFSSGDRSTRGFLPMLASCLEALILPR